MGQDLFIFVGYELAHDKNMKRRFFTKSCSSGVKETTSLPLLLLLLLLLPVLELRRLWVSAMARLLALTT